MLIYAISNSKQFIDSSLKVLECLEFQCCVVHSVDDFFTQMQEEIPRVVMIDYEYLLQEDIKMILNTIQQQYEHHFIAKVLVHDRETFVNKVQLLSSGVDYFLPRPVNMLELLAYLSSVGQFINKCWKWIHQETRVQNMETIASLNTHLAEHVKVPIQRFIDFKLSKSLNAREIKEYLVVSRRSAVEVLAAINTLKEQLQTMIGNTSFHSTMEALSDIFEKNLLMANAAYDIENDKSTNEVT